MEQHSLETGQGRQVEVSCLVRGEPKPRVVWYRSVVLLVTISVIVTVNFIVIISVIVTAIATVTITIIITVTVITIAIIIVGTIMIPTVHRNAEVVPLKGRIEAQMAGPRHVLLLHHLQVR